VTWRRRTLLAVRWRTRAACGDCAVCLPATYAIALTADASLAWTCGGTCTEMELQATERTLACNDLPGEFCSSTVHSWRVGLPARLLPIFLHHRGGLALALEGAVSLAVLRRFLSLRALALLQPSWNSACSSLSAAFKFLCFPSLSCPGPLTLLYAPSAVARLPYLNPTMRLPSSALRNGGFGMR